MPKPLFIFTNCGHSCCWMSDSECGTPHSTQEILRQQQIEQVACRQWYSDRKLTWRE